MKYVKEFTIILFVSFAGEVLRYVLPLPVPASIYGLVLMLLALCTGAVKLEHVKQTGDFLVEIMPILFIPAAVGLLDSWVELKEIWLPVTAITILTTVFVMAVAGRATQCMIRKDKKKHEGTV